MTKTDCLFERVSDFGAGMSLLFIALGFSIIGVTALPMLGLFAAAASFLLAVAFFAAPKSQECSIS